MKSMIDKKTVSKTLYRPRLTIAIGSLIAIFLIGWGKLDYSIYQKTYLVKAGLNWFNIRFYYGYTLVAAALFSLLLIKPRVGQSDLFNLMESPGLQSPRPFHGNVIYRDHQNKRIGTTKWFLWQLTKWLTGVVVFTAFEGIPFIGKIMNPIRMMVMGYGSWGKVIKVFFLPLFPVDGSELVNLMPVMEIQYRFIHIIAGTLLIVVFVRMILRGLTKYSLNDYGDFFMDLSAAASLITFYYILGAPYWLMNITTRYVYAALWVVLALSVFTWVFLRSNQENSSRHISRDIYKKGIVVLVVLLVIDLGAITFFYLNWNNKYISYEWDPQTDKEITVTRWSAGLDSIKVGSLLNLPTSNAATTLNLVRQWDQTAAAVTMTKEIGAYNWMSLASSEIVFINETEYWVAPTAPTYPSSNWISRHLIYTHAGRFMVINTHNGEEVTPEQAFRIPSEPQIYYGQTPSTGVGFKNSVYVHIPGYDEVQNTTYDGEPDYTLKGWQKALWFISSEGQFGFAFADYPIEMLWKRDVMDRVKSVLIPGENVYFVLQIYVKYPLRSGFAASPYLRFFGVVLVNAYDGSIQGYTVHDLLKSDEEDFITRFYDEFYGSWGKAPDWLAPQIRYPEMLLGTQDVKGQLDYDFIYHVKDPFIWRSGSDFYERPTDNVVQYIPWAIGNQTYFVGMQLAHFLSAQSKNLAGVYIAYGGDRLGQIDLFQNPSPSNTFIGPSAAENALSTSSMVRTQLTLLPNYRIGSYLLYSINGQLDYFVAVYTNPGTEGVVTQLPFMTAISPSTGSVGLGSDASASYYNLVKEGPTTTPSVDRERMIEEIRSEASSRNLKFVNATAINPTVWIKLDQLSLSSLGVNDTVAKLFTTLDPSIAKSIDDTLYMWNTTSVYLNFGVLEEENGIVRVYYVSVG
jgi:hypothetical protein